MEPSCSAWIFLLNALALLWLSFSASLKVPFKASLVILLCLPTCPFKRSRTKVTPLATFSGEPSKPASSRPLRTSFCKALVKMSGFQADDEIGSGPSTGKPRYSDEELQQLKETVKDLKVTRLNISGVDLKFSN